MSNPSAAYDSLEEWVAREAIAFSLDSPPSLNAATDRIIAELGESLALLGLGEPTHGAGDFLVLRNRIFERLVESHGFTAIAIESSFPRGRIANDYLAGRGGAGGAFDAIRETGFSHGFGKLDANRELIEWMRRYNADPAHATKLQFYGFDAPTEMTHTDSPRQLLHFALDYLADTGRRQRIDELLGSDAAWENPAAMMDPSQSIGLSPAATTLRIETEDLISTMCVNAPELIANTSRDDFLEALQHATVARSLLTYHAGLARPSPNRIAELLGIRDLIMANTVAYTVQREQARDGKVFAFAHNSHLQRGEAKWQLGTNALAWWPAGAHVHHMLGPRYAVIGTGVAVSESIGIGQPQPGTLEALITRAPAEPPSSRLIPTHQADGLPAAAIAALPTRSANNPGYFPLSNQSLTDFDYLAVLHSI